MFCVALVVLFDISVNFVVADGLGLGCGRLHQEKSLAPNGNGPIS